MALLWLPGQPRAVAAKHGEWSPRRAFRKAGGRAAGAARVGRRGSLSTARAPAPRRAPRRARLASPQAGRWLPAAPASGPALRKLVCPSGSRVPLPLAPPPPPPPVPGPRSPRRGLHDKQPPLFSAVPPTPRPAVLPARSCHGSGMQTSGWEQKAPLRPGGGRPPRSPARRSREVHGWRRLSSPFPRRRRRRRRAAARRVGSWPGAGSGL